MNYEDRVTKSYIEDALGSCARIATGSYVGTGEYGIDHPNSLIFPFTPKIIMLVGDNSNGSVSYGSDKRLVWEMISETYKAGGTNVWRLDNNAADKTFGKRLGNTFYWYTTVSSGAAYQFNYEGRTYYWLAIA